MPAAVVFCNPILDIVIGCDAAFLKRRGLVDGAYTEYIPSVHGDIYEEALKRPDRQLIPGGSGQNSARLLERLLNEEVAFIGCVGGKSGAGGMVVMDEYAQQMSDVLRQDHPKMIPCYDLYAESSTGVCCVCINGAQRALCTNLGATAHLSQAHLDKIKPIFLQTSPLVYVTGYFVTANPKGMLDVCMATLPHQVLVIALPPPFLLRVPVMWEVLETCLTLAHCLVSNKEEWLAYHQMRTGEQTIGDIVDVLKSWCALAGSQHMHNRRPITTDASSTSGASDDGTELPPLLAICTDGANSVHAVASLDAGKTCHHLTLPLDRYQGTIIDSNGCGDAFIASILASIHKHGLRSLCTDVLKPALKTASAFGAFELSKPGFGIPTPQELAKLPVDAL